MISKCYLCLICSSNAHIQAILNIICIILLSYASSQHSINFSHQETAYDLVYITLFLSVSLSLVCILPALLFEYKKVLASEFSGTVVFNMCPRFTTHEHQYPHSHECHCMPLQHQPFPMTSYPYRA